MKRIVFAGLALSLVLGVAVALAGGAKGEAKSKAIEGTLVDTKCYFMDSANAGNDHGPMKGCGTLCAKGGSPVGILTAAGKHYPVVVSSIMVADHVGKTVRVTGTVRQGSLVLDKGEIEVQEGGSWKTVKLGGMM